jgi:thiol-disulfide isomerase/thioredoxin
MGYPRRVLFTAAAAICLTGLAAGIDTPRPAAPEFTARTIDGERFTNDLLKGKVVLLQFWATWCGYCRRDQAAVDTMVREFSGDGLVVLAVDVGESAGKVRQYLERSPRACKVVLTGDTNLAAVFSPRSFPYYVAIDKDGKIAGVQNGAGGEDALRQLLSKAGLNSR